MQLERLEERVNAIQQQHQYDVNSLNQEYQEKVQETTLQLDRIEEKVNAIQQQQHQHDVNSLKQEYQEKVQETTLQLDRIEEKVNAIQQQHQHDVNSLKQEYQEKVQEKTMQLGRLEEKVNAIQQQHQYDVNSLKQEYQEKVRILQNKLKQKVNTTQTNLEQKLSTERKIFLVCLLLSLLCLMLYLTKLEDGVQKNLEEKVDSFNTHLRVTEESRTFTWKITSFAIKSREAKNKVKEYVESYPFHRYGYKLKLRLYPNGGDSGENTHLSMYIFVMKGEYGAILPWPFKKKVTVTLLDQQEDPVERENVLMSFIPVNEPECFARPTQEQNTGYGHPKFITPEKLHSWRYLVDDTLFVQVEIGP